MEPQTILIIASVSFAAFFSTANFLRKKIPRTVQCWFCQHRTKVDYADSNSWFCPQCEQYNGFSQDGDYNRVIPSLYDEKRNYCVTMAGRRTSNWKKVNSLCDTCNHNQNLKIKQLAAFVPLNENHYNEEIEHFREQLEKCYKLCNDCETLLRNVLSSQQNISGPRRLIVHTINKIQTQGRGILKISFILSLVLTLTALTNLHSLRNSKTAVELQGWLSDNYFYQKGLELLKEFVPKWVLSSLPSSRDLPIVFILSGALFQTVRCYNHKSMWCLLNWCSWLLLVVLSWFPNVYEELITYLQVIIGSVSLILTGLIILNHQRNPVSLKKKKQVERIVSNVTPTFGTLPRVSPLKSFPIPNISTSNSPSIFKPVPWNENTTDFGISKLNLGTIGKPKLLRKHQETSPFSLIRPERNMSKQTVTSVLSPPRFTFSNKSEKLNSTFEKPLTRSSSYSSGFVSISDTDRSHTPSECGSYEPNLDPGGYITSYNGYAPNVYNSFSPMPFSPLSYYHFAAEYQRMYMPPSPPAGLINPSCGISCQSSQKMIDIWSVVYLVPILILVASNIALLWTVYNKKL